MSSEEPAAATLPDLLRPGLRVVFCGTAAGTISAEKGQYYAGPGNRFWPVLADVGMTPRRLEPSEYQQLLDFGIGLTDVAKSQSGGDSDIDFEMDRLELASRLTPHAPAYLCFNGKRAAQEALGRKRISYGLQSERFGSTRIFVAPSTSGAARRYWDVEPWHELATLVRAPG